MSELFSAKNHKKHVIVLSLIILVLIVLLCNSKFDGFRTEVIGGDGRGYYAFLPSVLLHNTLDFTEIYEQERSRHGPGHSAHYFIEHEGIYINKYTSGVALLLLPFFLLALLLSYLFGFSPDGYSLLFQYGALMGSVFYGLTGLYFTYKLLRDFQISPRLSLITVLLFLFGTNLFFYTFMHPAMSHVYSFAMLAVFMFYIQRSFRGNQNSDLFWAAIALGISILIRPLNGFIILVIPFLAIDPGILGKKAKAIFVSWKSMLIIILPVILILGLQIIILLVQTGKPYLWTYQGEGFDFGNPHISDVLFSYRKGLFVYTPLLLISLFGLIPLARRSVWQAISALVFLAIITYLVSSWWNWFYGDSFGMRPFIDYYPLFAVLLAVFLQSLRKKFLMGLAGIILGLMVFLNLFQTYQYQHAIIHHDAMTKGKYWYVFLKSAKAYENVLGDAEESIFKESPLQLVAQFNQSFDSLGNNWSVSRTTELTGEGDIPNRVCALDSTIEYGVLLRLNPDSIFFSGNDYYIRSSVNTFETDTNATMNAYFVASVNNADNENIFYKAFRIKPFPDDSIGSWHTRNFGLRLPRSDSSDYEYRFYIWNKGLKGFYIDDFDIKIFEIIESESHQDLETFIGEGELDP